MARKPYFSVVRFLPLNAGGAIDVSLDSDWVMQAGVKPDVNSAIVSWVEYDQLIAGVPAGQTALSIMGNMQFWSTVNQASGAMQKDHEIGYVYLVDIEPLEFGCTFAGGTLRPIKYRLYFADYRQNFAPPKGGTLRQGIVNGKGQVSLIPNSGLIEMCLLAMGFGVDPIDGADYSIDPAVDQVLPMRDLEWRGNPPAVELERILEYVGAVCCPQSGGAVRVDCIGTGKEPKIPFDVQVRDRDLGRLDLPGLNRKGKAVVFSSAPHPVYETITFDDQKYYDFVVPEDSSAGGQILPPRWADITNASWLAGQDPMALLRKGFDGLSPIFKSRADRRLFRCLRLKPNKRYFPLAAVMSGTLHLYHPIVKAKIAVQDPATGTWSNSKDLVECTVERIDFSLHENAQYQDQVGNKLPDIVLIIDERLVQVDVDGVTDLNAHAVSLGMNDIEITVTTEQIKRNADASPVLDGSGKPIPVYFELGYLLSAGAVRQMTAQELVNALADPETLIVSRPEMVMVTTDGQPIDPTQYQAECSRLAQRWLPGSGDKPSLQQVIGFCAAELSGRVTKISWNREPRTKWEVMTWWNPRGVDVLKRWKENWKYYRGRYPGQESEGPVRQAMNAPGVGTQFLTVPVMPGKGGGAGGSDKGIRCSEITGIAGAGGRYFATEMLDPTVDVKQAGNLARAELGQATGRPILLVNSPEVDKSTHVLETMKSGFVITARIIRSQKIIINGNAVDGVVAECEFVPVPPYTHFTVLLSVADGAAGDCTHACTWTYRARDLDGNVLAAKCAPQGGRELPGGYLSASIGTGYFDQLSQFFLYRAEEKSQLMIIDQCVVTDVDCASANRVNGHWLGCATTDDCA